MDLNNRLMLLLALLLGAVTSLGVAYVAFQFYDRDRRQWLVYEDGTDPAPPRIVERSGGVPGGSHAERIFAQRSEIKYLETLLDKKTELLERKTKLLDEKTAEQRALKDELDEAITMLEMLAEEAFNPEKEVERDAAESRLRNELRRLSRERNRSLEQDFDQELALEELRAELEATDRRIVELQEQTGEQIATLALEKRELEAIAMAALAQTGTTALPALAEAMVHESPSVRVWAARVLGRIGSPASEATPLLVDALTDSDAEVRAAAKRALDLIESGGTQR